MPAMRPQKRVEYFELFFDLVYVFTLIRITGAITEDGSLLGIVHGTVVLALVWWVWVAFTAMSNMGLPQQARFDWRPLVFVVAMGLVLLMALAVPEAFWAGGKLFAYSYLGLALVAMAGQFGVSRYNPAALRGLARMWPVSLVLPAMVVITSYIHDTTMSVILIAIGFATALAAPFAAGSGNLPITTSHLAERYSLFMLIVLGESIISIGEGATKAPLSGLLVLCVLLALALVVVLWRQYMVAVLYPGERALERLHEPQLTTMVRFGYTFAHFAMVWGVVMIAVAIKTALIDIATPLDDVLEAGLAAGTLTFIAATAAFSRLAGDRIRVLTLVSLGLLAALVIIGPQLPTAVLLIAVTLAAAIGIDPRAMNLVTSDDEKPSLKD
ncbi:MAG: hypothetical protein RL347_50 [Actinomycetota bacterium]|jgi:low temperature requirement protein LtrA